jgi:hypothetical protein
MAVDWFITCATPMQTSRLFAAKLGLVDATAGAALEGFDLTTQMPEVCTHIMDALVGSAMD